jgi:hypothetical protein
MEKSGGSPRASQRPSINDEAPGEETVNLPETEEQQQQKEGGGKQQEQEHQQQSPPSSTAVNVLLTVPNVVPPLEPHLFKKLLVACCESCERRASLIPVRGNVMPKCPYDSLALFHFVKNTNKTLGRSTKLLFILFIRGLRIKIQF